MRMCLLVVCFACGLTGAWGGDDPTKGGKKPDTVPDVGDEIPVLVDVQVTLHRFKKGKADKDDLRAAAQAVFDELKGKLLVDEAVQDRYLAAVITLGAAAHMPISDFRDGLSDSIVKRGGSLPFRRHAYS